MSGAGSGGGGGGKGRSIKGGSGGGGQGKSISSGGNSQPTESPQASSRFTPEEQTAMDSTVSKLMAAPKEQRDRAIKQMGDSLRSRLDDAKKAESDALRRQASFKQNNPNTPDERNHFNSDVEKAQTRLKAAKNDWNKFVQVANRVIKS